MTLLISIAFLDYVGIIIVYSSIEFQGSWCDILCVFMSCSDSYREKQYKILAIEKTFMNISFHETCGKRNTPGGDMTQ